MITFLGTGGDSFVIGRQLRSSGGIIIQIEDNQFHIDPGPGALNTAIEAGVNLRANTALLVSNNNIHNCNDINAVIDAMTYGGFDKKGVLVSSSAVINGTEEQPPLLQKFYKDCLERFIALEGGRKVAINDIEIEALKTKGTNAIGFKFTTPNFILSYSGDTKYSIEILEQYKNSNILILNVPKKTKEEGDNCLTIEDAIKIIKKINPRLAIITHFGIELLKADPIYGIREIQKQTNVQTIAAKDRLVVNPLSYSISMAQKTLKTFSEEKKEPQEVKIQEIKEKEQPDSQ